MTANEDRRREVHPPRTTAARVAAALRALDPPMVEVSATKPVRIRVMPLQLIEALPALARLVEAAWDADEHTMDGLGRPVAHCNCPLCYALRDLSKALGVPE